jgi:hypothetical protein
VPAPAVSALTTPVVIFIETTVGALLAHVPPDTESVSVQLLPVQMLDEPVITEGAALIDTCLMVKQPVDGILYVMLAFPAEIPVTIPEVELAVAIEVLLLHHVPLPPIVLVSILAPPLHIFMLPVIGAGNAYTLIFIVV